MTDVVSISKITKLVCIKFVCKSDTISIDKNIKVTVTIICYLIKNKKNCQFVKVTERCQSDKDISKWQTDVKLTHVNVWVLKWQSSQLLEVTKSHNFKVTKVSNCEICNIVIVSQSDRRHFTKNIFILYISQFYYGSQIDSCRSD